MQLYNSNKEKKYVYEETITKQCLRKDDFSKYIGKIQKEKGVSTKELAKRVGIEYESFRKIINRRQPTKSRDCIIAICSQLQMDFVETNDALIKYDYMPCLEDEGFGELINSRDKLLKEILDDSEENPLSINEINKRLISRSFSPLEIKLRYRQNNKIKSKTLYEINDTIIKIYEDEILYDRYNSLSTMFHPNRYTCRGDMYMTNVNTNEKLIISYISDETYILQYIDKTDWLPRIVNKNEVDDNLMPYYSTLRLAVIEKLKKYYSCSNDTKNYISRKSVNFIDDRIVLFTEKFYYRIPERNHYYFLEYVNGKYTFSILNESIFMKYYLTKDEYKCYFGKSKPIKRLISFNSLDEIDKYFKEKQNSIYGGPIHLKNEFTKMKCEVDELFQQIKNKEKYIRNLDEIFEYCQKNLVCKFFGLEKEFNLHEVNEGYDYYLEANESAMVLDSQTNELAYLTLEDLYEAFELGLNTKDDILRIKNKYGSIIAILY